MARQLDLRRIKAMGKDEILALPIVDLNLCTTVKGRLSRFLADESEGRLAPEDTTISDLLHSSYDLNKIPAFNDDHGRKMFFPSVCEKIILVLQERYRIDYAEERKKYNIEQVLALPITKLAIAPYEKGRIAGFLSFACGDIIPPEEMTVNDLLRSAFNLNEMFAYYEGSRRKMFSAPVCEKIIRVLEDEYGIDYEKERKAFLANHIGLESFIFRAKLPNDKHFVLLRRIGNYNATFRDLLYAPFDFRKMMYFGKDTNQYILHFFEVEGIDYEASRRK